MEFLTKNTTEKGLLNIPLLLERNNNLLYIMVTEKKKELFVESMEAFDVRHAYHGGGVDNHFDYFIIGKNIDTGVISFYNVTNINHIKDYIGSYASFIYEEYYGEDIYALMDDLYKNAFVF